MGQHTTDPLRQEMLEAFLAIEEHDAHVKSRRAAKAADQSEVIATSIRAHRRMFNASGIPETETPPRPAPVNRRVQDPSLTDANYYAARAARPGDPHLGKVWVQENAMERIGALVFIRRRLAHHEQAAERFKTLYEARYGSGNPAMDPSRVQVDTSPIAHDSGMAAKIDRTRDIRDAEDALGKPMFDRIVACVVLGIPAGEGHHWRKRAVHVDALLDALDSLSTLWGYRTEAA